MIKYYDTHSQLPNLVIVRDHFRDIISVVTDLHLCCTSQTIHNRHYSTRMHGHMSATKQKLTDLLKEARMEYALNYAHKANSF